MLYILKANTNENGWSFEDCYPIICNSYTIETGLNYIFEAENDEEANEMAARFIFYFEQEYIGESNIINEDVDSFIEKYTGNKRKLNGAVVDEIPEGWVLNDTQTTPVGYHRYCNNKSHFYSEYDWCLVKGE